MPRLVLLDNRLEGFAMSVSAAQLNSMLGGSEVASAPGAGPMQIDNHFRQMFPNVSLEIGDMFLLEAFQIAYLPGWAPEEELASVLLAHPSLKRFMLQKCPEVQPYIDRITEQAKQPVSPGELLQHGQKLVWTIADMLVYNKCPEAYDNQEFHKWDFAEITSLTSLEGKIVIDGGAGTGRVALDAAPICRYVFAVEPVTRLREFLLEKAFGLSLTNVFVTDGYLHRLPFAKGFADVLITSHALGWKLEQELQEFERVVKPGGTIIHCPGTSEKGPEEDRHHRLISAEWGYKHSRFWEADGWKRKYWKETRAT